MLGFEPPAPPFGVFCSTSRSRTSVLRIRIDCPTLLASAGSFEAPKMSTMMASTAMPCQPVRFASMAVSF